MAKKREYVIESKGFKYVANSREKMLKQITELEEKIKQQENEKS